MPIADVVAGPADTSGFLTAPTARCATTPAIASLTVPWTLTGTATPGTDYTALSGNVTFSGHQTTATVTVTPIADGIVDDGETVIATIDPPSAGSAVGSSSGWGTSTWGSFIDQMVNQFDLAIPQFGWPGSWFGSGFQIVGAGGLDCLGFPCANVPTMRFSNVYPAGDGTDCMGSSEFYSCWHQFGNLP
jgi:hypothetical protein